MIHKNGSINKYLRYIYSGLRYLVYILISKIYNSKVYVPVVIASYTNYWTKFNVTKDMQKGVTTIALQHGVITDTHWGLSSTTQKRQHILLQLI